jgi:hypothetical protein
MAGLRTQFHRVVFNDWGTSRPAFTAMAVKSKPPAMRVVVDSQRDIFGADNRLTFEICFQKNEIRFYPLAGFCLALS